MSTCLFSHAQLIARFEQLDAFLLHHQALWRPRPFTHIYLPWEADHSELSHWLRSRSLEEAEAAHNHPETLPAPAPFCDLAKQTKALAALHELPRQVTSDFTDRQPADVPGRKWQQIQAFDAALGFSVRPGHWLDWCAGKGHLGRHLAAKGGMLTCLELNSALVDAGAALSQRMGIQANHLQQDVLGDNAVEQLSPTLTPVALHACGDLHVRLLELSIERGCPQLAVAPCCYNRIQTEHYQPLSRRAQRSELHLSKEDLALPLSETVTAGARERRQRDQSMAWRLGFDLLQRDLRGHDSYLPTPSLPSAWLKKSFEDYCRHLAALKGLPEPRTDAWATLEQSGWQRLAQVRNLELLRALFRRPLELWLLFDRALLLAEHDYDVQLGTFCPSSLTPRNLLLIAERSI